MGALIWVNVDASTYDRIWTTRLSVHLGGAAISMDVRGWINSGLMSFFFLVVGLEARREFDIGEFRERPRIILPVLAGLGGMAGAIGLYLAINAGRTSVHGWGVAMSTDTAFALGMLALLGRHAPERLRGFILTLTVVDDIVGLVVIATVYTHHLTVGPLIIATVLMALAVFAATLRIHYGLLYFALAAASWVALVESGVDPVVVGLAAGLIAYAAPPARIDLERTSDLFRDFREQPTAGMARQLRAGVRTAVSPNDRLQQLWHPWTSYLIVPLFGLANAGIPIDPGFLSKAYTSPITLGDRDRLRRRQANRDHGHVRPRQQGDERPTPSGSWLDVRARRRHPGRDGLHRLAARRFSRVHRSPVEGGHARRAHCRNRRQPCSPGWCSRSPDDCRRRFVPGRSSASPRQSWIWRIPSIPTAITSAGRRTPP